MKKMIYFFVLAGIIFSCSNPTVNSMSKKTSENKALVQRFYNEVLNAHDIAMVDSFCSADFLDHNPDPGFTGKGIADLVGQFNNMYKTFPDMHVNVDFMVAEGDTVVSYLTFTGTNSGPMGDMPATNKSVKANGIDIIVIKGGKGIERWGIFDQLSVMSQLGMMGSGAPPDASQMGGN